MNAPEPTTVAEYIDLVVADTSDRLVKLLERMEAEQLKIRETYETEVEQIMKGSVR